MKQGIRMLILNCKSILSLKRFLFIVIIYIFIFMMKKDSFGDVINLSDYIKIIFHGPNTVSENVIELLIWSLYQFYLIYMAGDYLHKEFRIRKLYIISRIGSKFKWYIYTQLTMLGLCLLYYLIGIIVITISIFVLNKHVIIFNVYEILNMWLVISISSYFILTIYIIAFLLTKNNNVSFILIIILLYLSIEFGDIFKIDKFLPMNQGILSKHLIENFGFVWSYIYLSLLIVINLFIIKHLILKNDLLSIIE